MNRLVHDAPFVLMLLLFCAWLLGGIPADQAGRYSHTLYDSDGRLIGASVSRDQQWRFAPSGEALPSRYVGALITFEDERFRSHPGVDPVAIVRALRDNLRAGRVVSGGSTITMQLARMMRGSRERTYLQKLAEVSLAVRIELFRSKEWVLREFANRAPFGGNVVGIDAASWRIFGRPLRDVTWAEAALLAVLPNTPSLIHIAQARDELKAKRDRLLARLHEEGAMDADELALSVTEPVPARPSPVPQIASHLLQTLTTVRPDQDRYATTIDGFLQSRATEILTQFGRAGRGAGANHAAALVVGVETGAVHAYVGNLPPRVPSLHGDFVDIVQSRRSTGSLLKPFLFAAMVDTGELLPGQLIPDVPTRIGGYVPQNPDYSFSGAVRAHDALARSLNVPAARMLRDYGVARFAGTLEESGFTTFDRPPDDYGIPLILGGAESTLWELTGAYASLARMVRVRGRDARTVKMPHVIADPFVGPLTREHAQSNAQPSPFSAAAAYLTLDALRTVERPSELAGWQHFASAGGVAWKTGTSYGLRDAWAIGVNEEYAIGVWVGNASGAGAPGLRGTAVAGPILFSLFELVGSGHGLTSPGGLAALRVCADSGHLASPSCPSTTTILAPGTAHGHEVCPYCRIVHLDASRSVQVTSRIYPVADMVRERWFVLPPAMAYYYERRFAGYRAPPPFDPRIRSPINPIAVEFPLPGSSVYVPVEMTGERGSIVATAHHELVRARLFWHLNGTYLGATRDEHTMELAPPAGEHLLSVVDESGNSRDIAFTVLGPR